MVPWSPAESHDQKNSALQYWVRGGNLGKCVELPALLVNAR